VSLRAEVQGRTLAEPIANLHDATWLAGKSFKTSNARTLQAPSNKFWASVAGFAPLAEMITAQLGGEPKMMRTDALQISDNDEALVACLLAAGAFTEAAKNSVENVQAKVILVMIGIMMAFLCRLMANQIQFGPSDPGSSDPFFPRPVAGNDSDTDGDGPVAIGSDGPVDGEDNGDQTEGGGGGHDGHGPLAHELDKDDSENRDSEDS